MSVRATVVTLIGSIEKYEIRGKEGRTIKKDKINQSKNMESGTNRKGVRTAPSE